MALAKNSLFEIENHGFKHRPLSVTGRSAYGIKGTGSVGDVVDEVLLNQRKIQKLTGKKTKYFRSGTAFYDDVAVKISARGTAGRLQCPGGRGCHLFNGTGEKCLHPRRTRFNYYLPHESS